jgi:glucosyl-dolichyl phosphate glucuronosyltransferase
MTMVSADRMQAKARIASGEVRIAQTIAICTHDRPEMLARCLAALADADRPELPFEIMVVANACRAETLDVACRFRAALPLVLVEEKRPGLSHARNRAIADARGELIVWLDDDALARAGLLRAYEAAARTFPNDAIFGGAILPLFEAGPPDWLAAGLAAVETVYAVRRPQAAIPFRGGGVDTPFGANFAIRTAVQRRFPFDAALGRRPGDFHAGGEEVAMIDTALAAGHKGRWVPDAIVDHVIEPVRQTEEWIWAHYAAFGRMQDPSEYSNSWLSLRALRHRRTFLRARKTLPPAAWLPLLVKAAIAAGRLEAGRAVETI